MLINFLVGLISFIILVLQISFFPVLGIHSDFLLAFILVFSFFSEKEKAIKFAFFVGLFLDLFTNYHFGVFTLLYTVFVWLLFAIMSRFGRKLHVVMLCAFIFFVIENYIIAKPPIINSLLAGIITSLSVLIFSVFCFGFRRRSSGFYFLTKENV